MEKFDEYKFFAESTQHLSERRQAATQTYLAVNTAIFGILGFLVKDVEFRGLSLLGASLPLLIIGILVCWIWHMIIVQYKQLIGWRYSQLTAMEEAMPESHKMYMKEWKKYFEPRQGKEKFGFSRLEKILPIIFAFLFALYGIGLAIATALS